MQCEVWSVEGRNGRDRLSSNYRSFMFGKLPPPACPGLCYTLRYTDFFSMAPGSPPAPPTAGDPGHSLPDPVPATKNQTLFFGVSCQEDTS